MHILIINPNPDFFTNPTLVYIVKQVQKSPKVRLTLAIDKQAIEIPEEYTGINYFNFENFSISWPKKIWKWISIIKAYVKLIAYCKKNKITKIIGIDPPGLIIAGRIKRLLPEVELHSFSFEIFFRDEMKDDKHLIKLKTKEIYYSSFIDFVLIQDEVRKQCLVEENNLNEHKINFQLIPVSPEKFEINRSERNLYREKFGILDEELIIIHSGTVDSWTGAKIIIDLLEKGLPKKYKILVHSRFSLDENNPVHIDLKEKSKAGFPLIIHDQPFSDYQDYCNFINCADFGLALYVSEQGSPYKGKNISEIGLSSGKFSTYMSLGLPTITTKSRSFSQLNSRYNFGLVIENSDEIWKLLHAGDIEKINKENCFKLYQEALDPQIFAGKYIDSLIN